MIERAIAIQIARTRAEEQGWAFSEPLDVVHRRGWFGRPGRFEIQTGSGKRGTQARFVIDAENGVILSEGYVPR